MRVEGVAVVAAVAVAASIVAMQRSAVAQGRGSGQTPSFEVDPLWPKPLPNHWILGSVTGVAVDAQDHVWVVHRGLESLQNNEKGPTLDPPASTCCFAAPPVLEFDSAGNLLGHWGGPGGAYEWPQSPAGIAIDSVGSVWIAGAGPWPTAGRGTARGTPAPSGPPPPTDAHVLKFSRTGQFLRQIGHAGKTGGSDSQTGLNRPANIEVDAAAKEIYVADGIGNRRVIVFDADTGAYKRHWGAYGEKPDDANAGPYDPNAPPARQFRVVSCARLSKDGIVYVCDRQNDRVQTFSKDGKFMKEAFVSRTTLGDGSVWDIAFSRDPQQQFLYVADGHDKKVLILRRDTLQVVSSFGDGGRQPGRFYGVGSIAVDSKGNVYTGETYEGKRVQKFAYKGMGASSSPSR